MTITKSTENELMIESLLAIFRVNGPKVDGIVEDKERHQRKT